MGGLDSLITDLALILIVAGVVTLLFKKLKQPVVLGYIVAGFLVGPNFGFFPTIVDEADINLWAELGIIVLLFSLGLEFSFKKLFQVGSSAVITALVVVAGMMLVGYGAGRLLSFTYLDSVFLGAMLSMSSTTIIIKAFTDLNLRKKAFANLVFGVLIVEDLFAVVMMVILSSIAVKNSFEGAALIESIAKLVFFLIIWFVVGVAVLPLFLKKACRFLNDETLLVVSMGLCLGMVVLATYVGFSSALGAFVMGSILAGTNEAERIGKVVGPVKDLFGAIFFVSVGMLVSPDALSQYALPICLLSLVVIVGQVFFGTVGMLASGQSLKISMQSGFSFSQIGEFAFIIASLGMSLNVIDKFLYPIVVAVSVITTFLTPYCIRLADPAYGWVEHHLPEKWLTAIDRYSQSRTEIKPHKAVWKEALAQYLWRVVLYSAIIVAIILISKSWFIPLMLDILPDWGRAIAAVVTLVAMSPFLWALMVKEVNMSLIRKLGEGRANRVPLTLMIVFRILLALFFVIYYLSSVHSQRTGVLLGLGIFIVVLILLSKRIQKQFMRIETIFMDNLNERELRKTGRNTSLVSDMHLAYMDANADCPFAGRRLMDSNLRKEYGVNVVSIQRGTKRINIPKGETRIFPGDTIGVIGTDDQIQSLLAVVEGSASTDDESEAKEVTFTHVVVPDDSPLIGQTSSSLNIRNQNNCLIVGIERADGTFHQPDGQIRFEAHDVIWLAGEPDNIKQLTREKIMNNHIQHT